MPKTQKKLTMAISLVVILALAAVAMVFVKQRSHSVDGVASVPEMAAKAVMYLAGVRQTATKDGSVQWELQSQSAELEAETGRMTLRKPQVEFFLENDNRVHLTANEGILNTKTNNIEVRGNVRLQDSRYLLTTEMLSYDHETRILHSASPVHIVGKTMSISAATMRYDLNTQQALFSGNVKGRLDEELPL